MEFPGLSHDIQAEKQSERRQQSSPRDEEIDEYAHYNELDTNNRQQPKHKLTNRSALPGIGKHFLAVVGYKYDHSFLRKVQNGMKPISPLVKFVIHRSQIHRLSPLNIPLAV
jgi:hypothetical protein